MKPALGLYWKTANRRELYFLIFLLCISSFFSQKPFFCFDYTRCGGKGKLCATACSRICSSRCFGLKEWSFLIFIATHSKICKQNTNTTSQRMRMSCIPNGVNDVALMAQQDQSSERQRKERDVREHWALRDKETESAAVLPSFTGQWGYNRFYSYALRGLHISQASCQKN